MKISITGVTGFLGKSIAEHISSTHIYTEVHGLPRGTDLADHIKTHKPDVFIHCAGEIYTVENMLLTNVGMVYEILNAIRDHSPKTRLIQIGSSSEYGPVPRPTTELDPINPQNMYEATKGAATLLCQAYARQFGLQTCVARIYSGYGVHEKDHRLFPRLYRAFYENQPMTLYDGVHDFIYIDDFVRGIEILMNTPWPSGEIVNFGSGIQYRNREVLDIWMQVTGKSAPIEYIDNFSKPHDTNFWCCDTSYAKMQYKFFTYYSLADGITDFIRKKQDATKKN